MAEVMPIGQYQFSASSSDDLFALFLALETVDAEGTTICEFHHRTTGQWQMAETPRMTLDRYCCLVGATGGTVSLHIGSPDPDVLAVAHRGVDGSGWERQVRHEFLLNAVNVVAVLEACRRALGWVLPDARPLDDRGGEGEGT